MTVLDLDTLWARTSQYVPRWTDTLVEAFERDSARTLAAPPTVGGGPASTIPLAWTAAQARHAGLLAVAEERLAALAPEEDLNPYDRAHHPALRAAIEFARRELGREHALDEAVARMLSALGEQRVSLAGELLLRLGHPDSGQHLGTTSFADEALFAHADARGVDSLGALMVAHRIPFRLERRWPIERARALAPLLGSHNGFGHQALEWAVGAERDPAGVAEALAARAPRVAALLRCAAGRGSEADHAETEALYRGQLLPLAARVVRFPLLRRALIDTREARASKTSSPGERAALRALEAFDLEPRAATKRLAQATKEILAMEDAEGRYGPLELVFRIALELGALDEAVRTAKKAPKAVRGEWLLEVAVLHAEAGRIESMLTVASAIDAMHLGAPHRLVVLALAALSALCGSRAR